MAFTVNNATVAQKFYTWADWTGKYGDPILKKGEIGFYTLDESDKAFGKIGDGVTKFSELGTGFTIYSAEAISSLIKEMNYVGKEAIYITTETSEEQADQYVIRLKIDQSDKVLQQSANGLKTNMLLDLESSTGKLRLIGNAQGDRTVLSEIDLPLEQILNSTDFDTETHILTLVFNTTKGLQRVEVDLSDLADTYTAGQGLSLSSSGEFSVKKSAGSESFLTVDSSGIAVTGITAAISTAINTTLKVTTTGSGNVITGLSKSGATITATKGMEVYSKTEVNSQVSNAITTAKGYTDALAASLADGLVIVCGIKD